MSHDDTGATRPRYCVIGAGAAGLAAVRALIAAGHDFEQQCAGVSGHFEWTAWSERGTCRRQVHADEARAGFHLFQ